MTDLSPIPCAGSARREGYRDPALALVHEGSHRGIDAGKVRQAHVPMGRNGCVSLRIQLG